MKLGLLLTYFSIGVIIEYSRSTAGSIIRSDFGFTKELCIQELLYNLFKLFAELDLLLYLSSDFGVQLPVNCLVLSDKVWILFERMDISIKA